MTKYTPHVGQDGFLEHFFSLPGISEALADTTKWMLEGGALADLPEPKVYPSLAPYEKEFFWCLVESNVMFAALTEGLKNENPNI